MASPWPDMERIQKSEPSNRTTNTTIADEHAAAGDNDARDAGALTHAAWM